MGFGLRVTFEAILIAGLLFTDLAVLEGKMELVESWNGNGGNLPSVGVVGLWT